MPKSLSHETFQNRYRHFDGCRSHFASGAEAGAAEPALTVFDFEAQTIDGANVSLGTYKGNVLVVVNVASKCGYTPQYSGLESLYEKFKDRGFAVLGFPCNQFGQQEPGTETEIQGFCTLNYGVKFPLFAKVDVNGPQAHPLYRYLTSEKKGILGTAGIKWNFTKFLVGRDGRPIKRYAPGVKPGDLEADVEAALG